MPLYHLCISQEVCAEQERRLDEEGTLTGLDLHQADLEELNIEGVLGFGEYLLSNLARLWIELPVDQKPRLQKVVFFPTAWRF